MCGSLLISKFDSPSAKSFSSYSRNGIRVELLNKSDLDRFPARSRFKVMVSGIHFLKPLL
jgi:hypothetical protein